MLRVVGTGAGTGPFALEAENAVASRDADGSNIDVSPDCECYEYGCDADPL